MLRTGKCRFGLGNWIFLASCSLLFTYIQGGDDGAKADTIRFTLEPADAVALAGSGVALGCSAGPRARLHWRHSALSAPTRDHAISPADALRKQQSNGSLWIQSVDASTAGQYQCVATVEGRGTIVSRIAHVYLAELPTIVAGPRSVLAAAGGPVLLPCAMTSRVGGVHVTGAERERRVHGAARPHHAPPTLMVNVTWLKNGSPLALEAARAYLSPSGALELEPVRAHDAANYACRVSLSQGSRDVFVTSEEIEVRVSAEAAGGEAAPRFIATPQPVAALEGSSVTFDCAAVGNPKPEISWLNNGAAIDLSSLDSRLYLVGAGSLRVQGARALDAGTYTCRAQNALDSVDHSTQLHVTSVPRVWIPDGAVVTARARGDVTVRCEVRGKPPPAVRWLKDGEPLSPNQDDMRLVDGSSLRIAGVLALDAGMFQCEARSAAGAALAAVRLRVQPPDADAPPPQYPPKKQKPKLINTKTFLNSLKPDSRPNSLAFTPPHPDSALNSTLDIFTSLVSDTADSTLYPYPEDSDFIGEISPAYTSESLYDEYDANDNEPFHAAIELDVEALMLRNATASAPRGLRAVIVKHRFVTLSWEPPARLDEPLAGYIVLYRVKGSQRERVARGPARQEMNVASLQPNTTYQFSVMAVTDTGASKPTDPLEVSTLAEQSLLGPPVGVSAEALGPHSLRVAWSPPPDAKEELPYRLFYTELESGRELVQAVGAGALSATLSGLRACTQYALRVAASDGASSPALVVATTADAPAAAPLNVTAHRTHATSILVRWEAPPARTHRGPLTGYKVRYRPATAPAGQTRRKADTLTTPADARRAELKGLERGTTYQVRVCAINANGSGPFSEWVTASAQHQELSERRVPAQPPPLTTRAGRDWISVWWGGGEEAADGVLVRGLWLGWGLGVPDEHSRELPAHLHSHVIRELQPNSEYVISLRASNSLGLGPPVYGTVRTLPPALHGDMEPDELDEPDDELELEEEAPPLIPPLGLKVIMLSGTTAVVYWTDPTLAKGQTATDGRHYVVRWSSAGGRVKTYNVTDLNCMIDELRPFTQYEFSVKLIKGGRESAWSMIVTNTTLEAPPASAPRDVRVSAAPAAPRALDVAWAAPHRPNGVITGYVVMYAAAGAGAGAASLSGEWAAAAVLGDRRSARVDRLRPRTAYYVKVQARNAAGLGPFSVPVAYTTPDESSDGSPGLGGATSAWLWASAGGACAVLALAAALALSLCCHRHAPPPHPDTSTYQKSSASAAIKPPDLWIHHDQMELKHMDKSHSSAVSTGSVDGPNALMSSTLTLGRNPPAEYEQTRLQPASLDRRHYLPAYVDGRWSSCGGGGGSDSDSTAPLRSDASQPRHHYPTMTGGTLSCGATCERRAHPRGGGGGGSHPDQSAPLLAGATLGSPQSSLASLAPLHAPPCGSAACTLGASCAAGPAGLPACPALGGDVYATALSARERGHYVAYEPLGTYTHRDSLSSEPPCVASTGSLQRRPLGAAPSNAAMHSFTLPDHGSDSSTPQHGSVRECSPYKKSNNSSPGHLPNRLQLGASVAHRSSELEPLTPSRSTERLQHEMRNLEGLMKDLSAITQQQFHC